MNQYSELIAKGVRQRKTIRKASNAIMLALTGLMTIFALVPLFWIIGYVIAKGGQAINLDFFTKLPTPMGVSGGGVLSAIEGTIVVTLLATMIVVPPALLAALYSSRYPNTPLGMILRFSTDVLSGVPSIVIGLFGYALIVKPQGHYSALAGSVALAILMLPTIN
jgi:phosphate transport system permease protein